jgi:hypothetical protein
MKTKRILTDCKTGKQKIEEYEFIEQPEPEPPKKGIDQEKLKEVLKSKGIINNYREVE